MTLQYDPTSFFAVLIFGWRHSAVRKVPYTYLFWITVGLFVGCSLLFHLNEPARNVMSNFNSSYLFYGVSFLGSFLTFNLAFFSNQCYKRWGDNWRAAILQWSRLNDLGLQVYAHLSYDHRVACDIMRLLESTAARNPSPD